jgi:hypothetical protein
VNLLLSALLAETAVPPWASFVLAAAAVVLALGTLWTKVFRPGMKLANNAETMLPLLVELTAVFRDTPDAFKILDEIVAEFRTDSGSSLRDVVNRLDKAAVDNANAAALLAVGVEAAKQLAERDRQEVQRLLVLLDRLSIKVDGALAQIQKVQDQQNHVAADLADSHRRADQIPPGTPGAAADAASQTAQ